MTFPGLVGLDLIFQTFYCPNFKFYWPSVVFGNLGEIGVRIECTLIVSRCEMNCLDREKTSAPKLAIDKRIALSYFIFFYR